MYVFISVISSSITAGVLFLIFLTIRPIAEKHMPAVSLYAMLIVIMLRLIIPFSPSLFSVHYNSSSANSNRAVSADLSNNQVLGNIPRASAEQFEPQADSQNEIIPQPSAPAPKSEIKIPWEVLIVWLWTIGMSVKFGISLYMYFAYRRRVVTLAEYSERYTAILNGIADGRKYPKVFISSVINSPMAIGLVKPIIVMPEINCTDEQAENILRHEYCHFHRGDLIIKWLSTVACAVHWFNPVIIAFQKSLNEWCELSCDAAAVKKMNSAQRKSYILTLLDMMEHSVNLPDMPLTTMSGSIKKINKRLEKIADMKRFSRKTAIASIAIITLIGVSSLLLGACANNSMGNSGLTSKMQLAMTNNYDIELAELSNYGDYFLRECYLISDSRLLLGYYTSDYVYQFRIYDLKKYEILCSSDEIQLENMHGAIIHLLNDNFYYLYNGKCYVYDFSCKLVKELSIPENTNCFDSYQYWLSNDLSKIVYVKNPNNRHDCLYLSNADGSNEEKIITMDVTSAVDLFFSEDNSCIGFEGVTIPKGQDTSIDCYGYITLSDKKVKVYPEDKTWVTHVGDTMLILDDSIEYGESRKGKVRILDLSSKKHSVITTSFADECESTVLGSDSQYMVGKHIDEENLTVVFTVYKGGKEIYYVSYTCNSKQNFIDLSGSNFSFDTDIRQIIAFYYDTDLKRYTIQSFSL